MSLYVCDSNTKTNYHPPRTPNHDRGLTHVGTAQLYVALSQVNNQAIKSGLPKRHLIKQNGGTKSQAKRRRDLQPLLSDAGTGAL